MAFVVAVAFLPAILAMLHDQMKRREQEATEAKRDAAVSVQLLAETYAGRLESARQVLAGLSQIDAIRVGRRSDCDTIARKFLSKYPHFENIGVILLNGELFSSAVPFSQPTSLADRPYLKNVLRDRDFSVGQFQTGRITHQPTLICAYPVLREEGELIRVVFAEFKLSFLSPLFMQDVWFPQGRLVLLDDEGTVLTSSVLGEMGITHVLANHPDLKTQPRGTLQWRDRVYAWASVPVRRNAPLKVIMDIAQEDLFWSSHLRIFKGVFLLVFSLFVAAALAGRVGEYFIMRHVERLLATTQKLSSGDLSARTGIGNETGELADLARAIDGMAGHLQRRDMELAQARQSLERRVEVRTQELAESNRQLESFSFSISHDLRAPLRAIDGFSQILLNEHAVSLLPEGRRILELVVKNSKHMAQLIDDLLAFSRLGRQEVVGGELNMGEMVREVYQNLTTPPGPRRVDFNVHPLPNARGDSSMIQQVWTNLMENALKFSSKVSQPVIEVGAEKKENHVVYFIKDNGVGFDPRFASKLFQVFQRLHSSSQFSGTGVGLAIVQRIIQKHRGNVWAESRPNEGACFFFSLPVESQEPRP